MSSRRAPVSFESIQRSLMQSPPVRIVSRSDALNATTLPTVAAARDVSEAGLGVLAAAKRTEEVGRMIMMCVDGLLGRAGGLVCSLARPL